MVTLLFFYPWRLPELMTVEEWFSTSPWYSGEIEASLIYHPSYFSIYGERAKTMFLSEDVPGGGIGGAWTSRKFGIEGFGYYCSPSIFTDIFFLKLASAFKTYKGLTFGAGMEIWYGEFLSTYLEDDSIVESKEFFKTHSFFVSLHHPLAGGISAGKIVGEVSPFFETRSPSYQTYAVRYALERSFKNITFAPSFKYFYQRENKVHAVEVRIKARRKFSHLITWLSMEYYHNVRYPSLQQHLLTFLPLENYWFDHYMYETPNFFGIAGAVQIIFQPMRFSFLYHTYIRDKLRGGFTHLKYLKYEISFPLKTFCISLSRTEFRFPAEDYTGHPYHYTSLLVSIPFARGGIIF